MNSMSYIAIAVMAPLLLNVMIQSARKAEKNHSLSKFTIRQPKMVVWIGIIFTIFCLSFTILMAVFKNDTVTWWISITFIAFALLGIFIAYCGFIWSVRVCGDKIFLLQYSVNQKSLRLVTLLR